MSSFLASSRLQESLSQEDIEAQQIAAAQTNLQDFEVLYQRYVGRIYRYMRTRVTNSEDAADLTQQVFLNALHALPKYRSRGVPFAAWLFRIAQYTLANKYRKPEVSISWDVLPEIIQISPEDDPERIMLHRERLEKLKRSLNELDAKKRELLALRFAGGLSSTEIAAVVGKSQAAVKKQLTRILHLLKENYHDIAE